MVGSFAKLNYQFNVVHIELLFVSCWVEQDEAITQLERRKEPTAHDAIFRPANYGLLEQASRIHGIVVF